MLTLQFHAQSVDRDWVAAANAQDQAEADKIAPARGVFHMVLFSAIVYAALIGLIALVVYSAHVWRW